MKLKNLLVAALAALMLVSCGEAPAWLGTTDAVTTAPTDPVTDPTVSFDTKSVYSGPLMADGGMLDNALQYVRFADNDLTGFVLPKSVWSMSDADLNREIAQILSSLADSSVKLDRAVKLYDTVNIDFVGTIGGVAFDGGNTQGQGTDVVIGITSYIDDFLDQLIGHKPGETVNVEVTFPDNYGNAELAGKDALFVTTINYIASTPELTDELVADQLATYGCQTAAQLRTLIREQYSDESIAQYISDHLCTVAITELPACYLDYQYGLMMEYYRSYAESYGMETEEFLNAAYGLTVDALKTEMKDLCEAQAHAALVTEAAMEKLGLTVGDSELSAYFAPQLQSGDYDSYLDYYGQPYLKQIVMSDTIYQYILAGAVRADS